MILHSLKIVAMNKFLIGAMTLLTGTVLSVSSLKAQEVNKDNTITLTGNGAVSIQPDMANISLSISYLAPTTRESKDKVDRSLRQVLSILRQERVEEEDIKTTSLNYNTEYDYTNNKRVKVGQRVVQSIQVTVHNLAQSGEKLSSILDKIVSVNNVELQSIDFGLEKTEDLYKESRALAFGKAKEKAEQYANLAGRRLGKVLIITEEHSGDVAVKRYNKMRPLQAKAAVLDSYEATKGSIIPTGEETIESTVTITFTLE